MKKLKCQLFQRPNSSWLALSPQESMRLPLQSTEFKNQHSDLTEPSFFKKTKRPFIHKRTKGHASVVPPSFTYSAIAE
ncbi:hypothetical protein M3204_13305 [Mesobacillus subterraneus]|uniref:hypothetical protein n=1 Tax=Mesobacillus subterraneus TaxID=285983 RepID=UPI00203EF61B|nr:hypothetical protein [Mesobacillus subterraneus]MCM3665390.1 hypothetical protein [Mesobacillus subterraneus]MCM3684602.1 hypothetical protein [Mesobacillus subterraneus]